MGRHSEVDRIGVGEVIPRLRFRPLGPFNRPVVLLVPIGRRTKELLVRLRSAGEPATMDQLNESGKAVRTFNTSQSEAGMHFKLATKAISLVTVVFLLPISVIAQDPQQAEKLHELFSHLEANHKFMGAVAVSRDGEVVFDRQYGLIAVDPDQTADSETQYRVGSITKTFTATMVMQLVEEEKLTLDTKLSEFFADVKNADQISIRQMLGHRSGLFNFTDNPTYGLFHLQAKTREQMLEIVEGLPTAFEPGDRNEYSNTNYVLLGFIVENLTGQSYADALQTRICDRVGLKHTRYMSEPDPAKNVATAFARIGDSWKPQPQTHPSIPHGAGAIMSTATDLSRFIEALHQGELVSPESFDEMKPKDLGMGLGLFMFPFGQKRAIGHNGGISGFQSSLAHFEEDNVSVALLGNGYAYGMNDILIGLLSIVFDKPYELPNFDSVKVSEDLLKRYEGTYASQQIPLKISVTVKGGELVIQGTGQPAIPVVASSETEFRADVVSAEFIFSQSEADSEFDRLQLKQGGAEIQFERQ